MLTLFMASVAAVALLFVPGFFFFRALRFSNITALACAPIASAAVYGVMPILYHMAGISCNVLTMLVMPTAVFAAAFAVSLRLCKGKASLVLRAPEAPGTWRKPSSPQDSAFDWAVLGLYILCGIIVCSITFIAALGAPDAFFSRYDNQTHLNLAQSFLDSGDWSSLHRSTYGNVPAFESPYTKTPTGFYPATWHGLVALLCLVVGTKVTIASNALVAALAAVVFPAGMFLLIRTLFPKNRGAQVAGALTTVAFATYPWVFPIKGPTLPNMFGFALMVSFMAAFIAFVESRRLKRMAVPFAIFLLVSFVSLAIAHTNSLFTAFVFLAPYGGHVINERIRDSRTIPAERKTMLRVVAIAAYLIAIGLFWAFCITTPILKGVIGYHHVEHKAIRSSIWELLSLRLTINTPQYAMVLVSLAGVLACIWKRRWWLLIPVVYMSIGYFISRVGWQPWLTIFMGLWYSLPYRAAACLCIYLMPVSALGLAEGIRLLVRFLRAHLSPAARTHLVPECAGGLVVALIVLATYLPVTLHLPTDYNPQSPFNSVYKSLGKIYAQDANRVYGAEEVAFVDKALEMIPEDALVVNSPHDGSVFAYGVNHMNAYFRSVSIKRLSGDAKAISRKLDRYATDPRVQEAVKNTGAQYVLQLDHGVSYEDLIKLPQYYEDRQHKWKGIDHIDDSTPGFSLVLSDGDMRLYRIDGAPGVVDAKAE